MTRDLTDLTKAHAQQLESESPFIWLYEFEVPGDPPTRYRLTNFTERVYYGVNSSGERLLYYPAPIVHGDVQVGSEGDLPTITVTVGNTGPVLMSTLDTDDGLVGQPATIAVVSSFELDNPSAALREEGEIVGVSGQRDSIRVQIAPLQLSQREFPPFIFTRNRCRYGVFGGAECAYPINAAGAAFTSCPRTLAACEQRGDDEVSLGLPRQHPARFGGFPGLPKVNRG